MGFVCVERSVPDADEESDERKRAVEDEFDSVFSEQNFPGAQDEQVDADGQIRSTSSWSTTIRWRLTMVRPTKAKAQVNLCLVRAAALPACLCRQLLRPLHLLPLST